MFEYCPTHSTGDDIKGVRISNDVGWQFTCERTDHRPPGPHVFFAAPPPPPGTDLSGIADELGLGLEIPSVLTQFNGQWVEYGIFEHAYAVSHPKEWKFLIERYSHSAIAPKQYTVSAFLASTLGNLQRAGAVEFHAGPATGRWTYNGTISWWSLPPGPDWDSRLSWEASGLTVEYVPTQTER